MKLPLLFLVCMNCAQADEWRTAWDGTAYAYAGSTAVLPGRPLDRESETLDTRLDFKAEREGLKIAFRPVLLARQSRNIYGNPSRREAYLSQWQARLEATPWNLSIGRDLLNWGPAQFRSPSSPFYFDNGRSDPMRELSGMDNLKAVWTPDVKTTVYLARIVDSGHVSPDPWKNTWLFKADHVSEDWSGGIALVDRGPFIGAHGQYTAMDALLLYAEASSYRRTNALQSPADLSLPFSVLPRSPRRTDALFGAAWTFEDGKSINCEYLRYGHGFDSSGKRAFLARIASPAAAFAPPLLGRDYLHLVLQSNLMESSGYWRLMFTHTDGSDELSGYGEHALNGRTTLFALAVLPSGGAGREFSSLFSSSLTVGLRFALQ
ncbi:MAG: hypothetical protein K2P57_08925 [Burkholderiales bacterium]|nr:hypothetical protein [Burkholderiales bacterium]